jgi:hypothetical protein
LEVAEELSTLLKSGGTGNSTAVPNPLIKQTIELMEELQRVSTQHPAARGRSAVGSCASETPDAPPKTAGGCVMGVNGRIQSLPPAAGRRRASISHPLAITELL